ncbi:MAG: hypothetical protein A2W00_06015 [Candidatus Eisenbacteria bacterium RBG_16_71_46]|nr:MAG: hypothetical protein A2W00_06015 [Candidatus Eisenbacteria bacterium RBG_16_71_46]
MFLKLLTAHLLGDYLVQSTRVASGKLRPAVLAAHVALHGLLLALVALTEPRDARVWLALLVVLAAHAAIDAWTSRIQPRTFGLLALDQSAHLASIVAGVAIARPGEIAGGLAAIAGGLDDARTWVLAAGAVAAVWGGAVLVGRWVEPFAAAIDAQVGPDRPGLQRAGRTIGLFERALIFLAILLRMEALIGFVIAAKAILRLPEARERGSRALAEYYLVGSLASVFWGVLVGVLVRAALGLAR